MFLIKDNKSMRFFISPPTTDVPSLHLFFDNPLLDVETIEKRIRSMIVRIDIKKKGIFINKNMSNKKKFIPKETFLF